MNGGPGLRRTEAKAFFGERHTCRRASCWNGQTCAWRVRVAAVAKPKGVLQVDPRCGGVGHSTWPPLLCPPHSCPRFGSATQHRTQPSHLHFTRHCRAVYERTLICWMSTRVRSSLQLTSCSS